MADQPPNNNGNNFYDKLALPPANEGIQLRLTLKKFEVRAKELEAEFKKTERDTNQSFDNLDDLEDSNDELRDSLNDDKKDKESTNKKLEFLNKKIVTETNETDDEIDENTVKKNEQDKSEQQVLKRRKDIDSTVDENNEEINDFTKRLELLRKQAELLYTDKVKSAITSTSSFISGISGIGTAIYKNFTHIQKTHLSNVSFCKFFDKTLGSLFSIFTKKGRTVNGLIANALNIFSVFNWVKTTASVFVTKIFDFFTGLGKIGWKAISSVFSIFTTPAKKVANFFIDLIGDFLSTPVGFTLAVGGALAAGYFLWEPAKEFISTILSRAWGWLVQTVADIFTNGDPEELNKVVIKYSNKVTKFLKDSWNYVVGSGEKIAAMYNNTIGQLTGLTSYELGEIFDKGIDAVASAWKTVKIAFLTIKESNVVEEFTTLWMSIKSLMSTKEDFIKQRSADESVKRLKDALQIQLRKQAENLIQSSVLSVYFNKYNGVMSEETKTKLLSVAQTTFKNFIENRKVLDDEAENTFLMNSIHVNIDSLVSNLMKNNNDSLSGLRETLSNNVIANQQTISSLATIKQKKDFNDPGSEYASQIDFILNNGSYLTKYVTQMSADRKAFAYYDQTKLTTYAKEVLQQSIAIAQAGVGLYKKADDLNQAGQNARLDTTFKISTLIDSAKNMKISREQFLTNVKSFLKDAGLFGNISKENAQNLVNSLLSYRNASELSDKELANIVPQAYGGVITGPTNALIGEAGYSEIVIPLNQDGMTFVYNSMKSFFNKEEESTVETNAGKYRDLIRRIKKGGSSKPDSVIYDMKNITNGVVGIN